MNKRTQTLKQHTKRKHNAATYENKTLNHKTYTQKIKKGTDDGLKLGPQFTLK